MEQLNQQKLECPDANMQQRYHLTEREQMVIIYLMLGFTNKEIANRINLSEYTVKEHLKRIMHKTQTTTRTGLLARMIFPTPKGAVPDVLSETIGACPTLPLWRGEGDTTRCKAAGSEKPEAYSLEYVRGSLQGREQRSEYAASPQ